MLQMIGQCFGINNCIFIELMFIQRKPLRFPAEYLRFPPGHSASQPAADQSCALRCAVSTAMFAPPHPLSPHQYSRGPERCIAVRTLVRRGAWQGGGWRVAGGRVAGWQGRQLQASYLYRSNELVKNASQGGEQLERLQIGLFFLLILRCFLVPAPIRHSSEKIEVTIHSAIPASC